MKLKPYSSTINLYNIYFTFTDDKQVLSTLRIDHNKVTQMYSADVNLRHLKDISTHEPDQYTKEQIESFVKEQTGYYKDNVHVKEINSNQFISILDFISM